MVNSGHSEVNLGPVSQKPHGNQLIPLHLAVGRASRLNILNIGTLGWLGRVPGIAPPSPPTHTHHPGYTPARTGTPGHD